jgi:hypothetical protein
VVITDDSKEVCRFTTDQTLRMTNNTANTLCYHDGSKDIKSVTLNSSLTLSSGTLSVTNTLNAGSFTPTFTALNGISSITHVRCFYMQVGTIVDVTLVCNIVLSNSTSIYFKYTIPLGTITDVQIGSNAITPFISTMTESSVANVNSSEGASSFTTSSAPGTGSYTVTVHYKYTR